MDWKASRLDYLWAVGVVTACTLAGFSMVPRFDLVNVAMIYLLGVVWIALRHSRGAAIFGSIASVVLFDVLFVPPQGALTVDDVQYVLTFAIILAVALVVSNLVAGIRREAHANAGLEVEAETERVRSALLASISHDLRSPLAIMTGASSTLAERGERLLPEERQALARSVFQQSREMSEHVAKVLQMTRLEAGGMTLERDWSSISEIAASALDRMSERLAGHHVMMELVNDLPLIRVDAGLLEQVFCNLLDNAAKHTRAGTIVRLYASAGAEELIVTVEDRGIGLVKKDTERMFDKFHRVPGERAVSGIGLGLSICRAIVSLHRGRIWAEQVLTGGIAIRFSIPLERTPPVPREPLPG